MVTSSNKEDVHFIFMCKEHTITYTYLTQLMWSIMYKLEHEDWNCKGGGLSVMCIFLLCLILSMSGVDVKNEHAE